MKILVISDLLAYGGASKLINDLLPRLKEQGHCCELLILTDEHSKYLTNLTEKGIKYGVLPRNIKGHIKRIQYIKNWIKKGGYDVIHANLFPVIYYVSIIKRIYSKCPPIIMTEHSTDNKRRHRPYLRLLEKFIYSNYDHIISISEQTQEQLVKWLKCKNIEKFTIIENGIDLQQFKYAKPYDKKKLFLDYRNGDVLILMVGSFLIQKNHKNMILAMKKLPGNYKLLLVGEGPLLDDIKIAVKQNNLEKRIVFLGFRRDVAEIMHTSDLICIPSLWEGFGLIAAEAMASGTTVVSSNVPGLSNIVGDCGLKFDPKEPTDIAKTIINSQNSHQKAERIKLGKLQAERYDIKRVVKEYEDLYIRLVQ